MSQENQQLVSPEALDFLDKLLRYDHQVSCQSANWAAQAGGRRLPSLTWGHSAAADLGPSSEMSHLTRV